MFDIAWSEFLLIGAVALVVIGPKDLPRALRTAGQALGKVRRMAAEFQGQFNEAMREAELHDLKKQVDDIGNSVQASTNFDPIEPLKDDFRKGGDQQGAAEGAVSSSGLDDAAMKEAEAKLLAIPEPAPLPAPVIEPDAAPAKPARGRRKAAQAEEAAVEAEPVPAEAARPARSRKSKAATEPAETEAAADAEAAPAKPARRRKAKTAEPEQHGGETTA